MKSEEVEYLRRSAAELSSIKAALRQGLLAAFPDMARSNENLASVIFGDRQLLGHSKFAELVGALTQTTDTEAGTPKEFNSAAILEGLKLPKIVDASGESSVPPSLQSNLTEIKKKGDEIPSNGELQTVALNKGLPVIKSPLIIHSLFGNDTVRGSYRDRINQTRKDLNEFFDKVDSNINEGKLPNPSLEILSMIHELQALRDQIAAGSRQ